ncbi:hypothetical protein CYMTET_8579 [Cymbomonas tetramitiformis]|uniref:Uncharacterized protein n=1 Tax=Cymbomonas tetramitiformis TaxID=36881 RepID=A0AAE0GT58_9CHLO|nr:hypothetical protein CYMTET_8579 [Cymbomonas tetramitiformis]
MWIRTLLVSLYAVQLAKVLVASDELFSDSELSSLFGDQPAKGEVFDVVEEKHANHPEDGVLDGLPSNQSKQEVNVDQLEVYSHVIKNQTEEDFALKPKSSSTIQAVSVYKTEHSQKNPFPSSLPNVTEQDFASYVSSLYKAPASRARFDNTSVPFDFAGYKRRFPSHNADNVEHGRFVRTSEVNLLFVNQATNRCNRAHMYCYATAADNHVKTFYELAENATDPTLLNTVFNPRKFGKSRDMEYRRKACRNDEHAQYYWCKHQAGLNGRDSNELDLAELSWRTITQANQRAKQRLKGIKLQRYTGRRNLTRVNVFNSNFAVAITKLKQEEEQVARMEKHLLNEIANWEEQWKLAEGMLKIAETEEQEARLKVENLLKLGSQRLAEVNSAKALDHELGVWMDSKQHNLDKPLDKSVRLSRVDKIQDKADQHMHYKEHDQFHRLISGDASRAQPHGQSGALQHKSARSGAMQAVGREGFQLVVDHAATERRTRSASGQSDGAAATAAASHAGGEKGEKVADRHGHGSGEPQSVAASRAHRQGPPPSLHAKQAGAASVVDHSRQRPQKAPTALPPAPAMTRAHRSGRTGVEQIWAR